MRSVSNMWRWKCLRDTRIEMSSRKASCGSARKHVGGVNLQMVRKEQVAQEAWDSSFAERLVLIGELECGLEGGLVSGRAPY